MSTDFWYRDKPIFGTNVVNFNMFKMTNLSRVSSCTQHIIVGARARECMQLNALNINFHFE